MTFKLTDVGHNTCTFAAFHKTV